MGKIWGNMGGGNPPYFPHILPLPIMGGQVCLGGGGGVGEGHCTLNLSINAIFPILILRTAEVPENYTKPPRGPKKRTSAPVLTQKHSDNA